MCSGTAFGVPAYPTKKTVKLQDGTSTTLQLTGDEFFHFYRAEDGRNFRMTADGSLRMMSDIEFGEELAKHNEERTRTNARRARRRVGEFVEGGIKGKKKGLVILVSFRDKDFVTADPQTVFNDFFNKEGYSNNGMGGSVKDYFKAQSYGQLEVDFDVVGPYKLSKNMSYYGGNDASGSDSAPQAMAEEACRLANPDVNYANYDWNNDGEVDQVFLIYAGYGENYGAEPNTIWPHAFYLPEGVQLDYMKLGSYACTCELMGTKGTDLTGVGTACHEFSHCLGLPDTYDTSYSGGVGMGQWDVMDHGSYNVNGHVPAGYTAYERWVSGWLEPVEINSATEVKDMKPLTEAPEAYILYNEGNRDEYYILENRQKEDFVDLISRQIRIASGEILDIDQTEVKPQGVAIEARITAENVWKNFAPSPGKITGYFPALGPGVRVDSHMYQGYSIPPFYDSLVAKLIVKARSYDLAVSKLERALDEFTIEGVRTTLPFLLAISKRRHFRRGFFDTSYIEERLQDILENTHDHNQENKEEVIAAITAAIQKVKSSRENG